MQESIYKSYDDLPMFLNAKMVAGILGVSPGSAYELMHDEKFPLTREARALLTQYQQAQAATEKRQFAEAAEILKAILAKEPADLPSQVLLARCEQSLKMPPPETWSGVFEVR